MAVIIYISNWHVQAANEKLKMIKMAKDDSPERQNFDFAKRPIQVSTITDTNRGLKSGISTVKKAYLADFVDLESSRNRISV